MEAHRPGTQANRESAVKEYVLFSRRADFEYYDPAPYNICWFLEHLAEKGLAATTISNYLSSLRTYFGMAGLDKAPLFTPAVVNAMRAISMNVRHVSRPALSIHPQTMEDAFKYLHTIQYPAHIKLAITWMFMGFLRQSNIAPRTTSAFDHSRNMTRDDVQLAADSVTIKQKWSKTMQKSQAPTTITLWAVPGSVVCPVGAYQQLLQVAPTQAPRQPLLQYRDGNPMTAPFIAKEWALLLTRAGIPRERMTLHGLRRGGASFSYHDGGTTLEDVMSYGSWASSAVRTYLTPQRNQRTTVHQALASLEK